MERSGLSFGSGEVFLMIKSILYHFIFSLVALVYSGFMFAAVWFVIWGLDFEYRILNGAFALAFAVEAFVVFRVLCTFWYRVDEVEEELNECE